MNKPLATIAAMLKLKDLTSTGCLLVIHLPVKAALLRRPDLAGQPLIITAGTPGRQTILDASAEAMGAREGQTLAEALSHCAGAVTLQADSIYLSEVNDRLLVALCEAVPNVEPAGLGAFYLDLTGMAGMHGGDDGFADAILSVCDERLSPRLGVGAGKFPAHCAAARADAGGWLQVPDDAAAWLAPMPVSWLPLERDHATRLAGFGIRTLGDVAALPPGVPDGLPGPGRSASLEPRQRHRSGSGHSELPAGSPVRASFQLMLNTESRSNFGEGVLEIQTYETSIIAIVNPKLLPEPSASVFNAADWDTLTPLTARRQIVDSVYAGVREPMENRRRWVKRA